MTLREQIKAADDLPRRPVACPRWQCTLFVRMLNGLERDAYERSLPNEDEPHRNILAMIRLVIRAACDAEGQAIFEEDDESWLLEKSSDTLVNLFEAAAQLNALGKEHQESLKKNSVSLERDALLTASP